MTYSTTFLNNNASNDLPKVAQQSLESHLNDLNLFNIVGFNAEDVMESESYDQWVNENHHSEDMDLDEQEYTALKELGNFHEYGLSFDLVGSDKVEDMENDYINALTDDEGNDVEDTTEADELWDKWQEETENKYFRFQISWGGPSTEYRIYKDRVEFVYMDWFCGVGFDVSENSAVEYMRDYFEGCGMLNWDKEVED